MAASSGQAVKGLAHPPRVRTRAPGVAAYRGESRWRHFVGTVADDPVATASTLLTNSTAGIYVVCTRPDARRCGLWCRDHLRSDAPRGAHRATFAVLGSSPMGQRIYERLGFRTIFSTRLFELDA